MIMFPAARLICCHFQMLAYCAPYELGAALPGPGGSARFQAFGSRQAYVNDRGVMSGVMVARKQGRKQ